MPAEQSRPIEARNLTRNEAAAYCRLKPSAFSDWVAKKIVPGPIKGTRRWDKRALDAALDRISGLSQQSDDKSALAQWKDKRDARNRRREAGQEAAR